MKVLKRNKFDVLMQGQDGGGGDGGSGANPSGVDTYPNSLSDGKGGNAEDKRYTKPDDPNKKDGEKNDSKSSSGDKNGKGDEGGEKELERKKGSFGKVTSGGIGGMIDDKESQEMQENMGVPVQMPDKQWKERMQEKIWKDIDRLKPIQSNRGQKGGSGNGNLRRRITELYTPKVDWKRELKKFIGYIMSGVEDGLGKRFIHKGDYFQSDKLKEDGLDRAVVAVDVSGSVMGDFAEFITEVVEIVHARYIQRLHVLPFAGDVHDPVVLKAKEKITPETFAHVDLGGGTEAIPDVQAYIHTVLKDRIAFCVIITDGYLTHGIPEHVKKWGEKVIWLVYDNVSFKAPKKWGRVIHVSFEKK